MTRFEEVARNNKEQIKYTVRIIDKKTKRGQFLNMQLTSNDIKELAKSPLYANCTILGIPNIRTATDDNIVVFKK